jgi:hypothetical protein
MYTSGISSGAKWIFMIAILITLLSIFAGFNLKDATWLNSEIAKAEAKRIDIETKHQQAIYELQEQLARAQTEAEIQAIQREQNLLNAQYEHDMQILAQDVINKQRMADVIINIAIYVGTSTGITAAISVLIISIAKAVTILRPTPASQSAMTTTRTVPAIQIVKPVLKREPYEPWLSREYRRTKIKEARYRERASRRAESGKNRNKMPLAE